MSEFITEIGFYLFDGFVWGCVLALIALGLALIYGIMGIINVAHGDMYMVGAVFALIISKALGSFWPAIIIVPLIGMLLAMPLERWVLRPFEGNPSSTIIATIGISYIIRDIVLMTFGGAPHMFHAPIQARVDIFNMAYSGYKIFAAGMGIIAIGLFWLVLTRTNLGIKIRATMENSEIADAIGINTSLIKVLSFGIGVSMAFLGGLLAAPIQRVYYLMGADILLFSFIVVVIGGLNNLKGVLVIAIILASFEGLFSMFLEPVIARTVIIALMSCIILIKPQGLFSP